MTRLSRRALLRGAGGVALALPALESLRARTARADPAAAPPKRFVAITHANGVFTPDWFPQNVTSETAFDLGPTHAAIAPLREHLLFTSGLDLTVAVSGLGEQHQRGQGALLTGAKLGAGTFVGNDGSHAGWAQGPSIDQAVARLIGTGTRVPSLQLGVHCQERDVSGVVSYAAADQPLLAQNDPRAVFHQLFLDGGGASADAERLRRRRGSVLDAVQVQLLALRQRVSTHDQRRLDEHLTLVRDLERRVTQLPAGACAPPPEPAATDFASEDGMAATSALMLDLVVAAFRCDLTRVVTVSYSDAKNHLAMPFLGITDDVHVLSHMADGEPLRAGLGTRDRWVTDQVKALLTALLGAQELDGSTLLDHTLVLWGTEVSRGNVHAHDDLPFVLAGHGAGFRMGRFVKWASRPHNELLLAIARAFGGTQTSYGDPASCAGPLTNLG